MVSSVRAGYEKLGIDNFYIEHSEDYCNPHYSDIKTLISEIDKNSLGNKLLDLCCGSGEITKLFLDKDIEGLDPYMSDTYIKNTGKNCLNYDFKDIVQGALQNKRYDTIICSYAMHLCEESMLNMLLYQLYCISNKLIILTPHKRPEINAWWIEEYKKKLNKTTLKVYRRQ